MLPPANRSKKPKIEPGCDAKNSAHRWRLIPGVGTVAAQTVHRQQPQREQEPLAKVGDAKHVRERFKKLHGSLRFPALLAGSADHLRRAAGLLDLLQSRFRKLVGFHRNLARQLARAEDLQTIAELS